MKKSINIIFVILWCLVIFSCNEKYLDTVATDTYNETNWWKSESQVISTLNGCYAVLRNSYIGGVSNLREENLTPNSWDMGGDEPLSVGAHNPSNDDRFFGKWNANYLGIGRVNYLLENIDRVVMEASLSKRIKGEALFLRALFYSNLIKYYGGVPLILEAPNFSEHRNLARNTRAQVLNQVLLDLDEASLSLPVSYSGSNIGRATKGAALALKARVLLFEGLWSEAALAAKQVMDLQKYKLFPNYRGLFLLENENNEEVIFDVQYKVPEYSHQFDITIQLQLNVSPTLDLINNYLMIDGKKFFDSPLYNPLRPYDNRDPRLHQTIIIPGYMYRGQIAQKSKYFSTGFGFKKFATYKDDVVQSNLNQSEINFIILRYADVLLMYAEAQNEVNGPDASVYDALNEIRIRAGMPRIPDNLTKDQMREVIRSERRIELVLESSYYHDIRRWRIAEQVMNAEVKNSDGEVVRKRTFNAARDYLWPIHEITIQENPELQQNPNYD